MDGIDLQLRELRQVLAGATERSFVRAARSLHISQPALSRSIRNMEEKAGFRLFERGREGAFPTDAGRMLLRQAEKLVTAASDMRRKLALIRGLDTGELRIGAGVFPTELFPGKALAALASSGSEVRLRMVPGQAPDLLVRLREREVDLVVADPAWLENAADVKFVPLTAYQTHLIVRPGHPLLGEASLSLEKAVAYPLITSSSVLPRIARMPTGGRAKHAGMQAVFSRWIPTIYTDSIAMMKDALAASEAVTVLPLFLVRHELNRRDLAVLPIPLPWVKATFAVIRLAHRSPSPLAEAFIRSAVAADARVQDQETRLTKRWIKSGKAVSP